MKKTTVAMLVLTVMVSIASISALAYVSVDFINKYNTILDPPKKGAEADIDILLQLIPSSNSNKTVRNYYRDSGKTRQQLGALGSKYSSAILVESSIMLFKASYNGINTYVFVVLDYAHHFDNLSRNVLYVLSKVDDNAKGAGFLILDPGEDDETIIRIDSVKEMPLWLKHVVLYLLGGASLEKHELGFIFLWDTADRTVKGNIEDTHPLTFYRILDVYHVNYDKLQTTIEHVVRSWRHQGYLVKASILKSDLIRGLLASTYNNYIAITSVTILLIPLVTIALYLLGRNAIYPKIRREVILLRSLGVSKRKIIIEYVRLALVFIGTTAVISIVVDKAWIELLPKDLLILARILELTAIIFVVLAIVIIGKALFSGDKKAFPSGHNTLLVTVIAALTLSYIIIVVVLPLPFVISSMIGRIVLTLLSLVMSVVAINTLSKIKSKHIPVISNIYTISILITVITTMVVIPAMQTSCDMHSIENIANKTFPSWIHNITFAYLSDTISGESLWYRITSLYLHSIDGIKFVSLESYSGGVITAMIRGNVKVVIMSNVLLKKLGLHNGTAYIILPPQSLTVASNADLFRKIEEANNTIQQIYLWTPDYPYEIYDLGKRRIIVLHKILGIWTSERINPLSLPPEYIKLLSTYEKPLLVLSESMTENIGVTEGITALINIRTSSLANVSLHPKFMIEYDELRRIYIDRINREIISSSIPAITLLGTASMSIAVVEVLEYKKKKNMYLKYLRSIGVRIRLIRLWEIKSLLLVTPIVTAVSAITLYLSEYIEVSLTFFLISALALLVYLFVNFIERRVI